MNFFKKRFRVQLNPRNNRKGHLGNKVVGKRGAGEENTDDDRHGDDLAQSPLIGCARDSGIVDCDDERGDIVEEGDDDDELGGQREGQARDREEEKDEEVDGRRDTVEGIAAHALENHARGLDGVDDGGQTLGEQNNVGRRASSVRAAVDGDADVGLLERGSVVDTVTSHTDEHVLLLQELDHAELVLGDDLRKTVGVEAAKMNLFFRRDGRGKKKRVNGTVGQGPHQKHHAR